MPIVGAIADRTGRRRRLLAISALAGSAATVGFGLVSGSAYLLGGALFLVASVAYACSIVVYNAFLPDIASPEERDRVSTRGLAFGYLGGGLLLVANLVLFQLAEGGRLPFDAGTAARISIAVAGLWWALFTLVPLAALRDRPPLEAAPAGGTLTAGFRQLGTTLAALRLAPMTLLFLAAYLLYNNGVQTVISQAAVFASEELELLDSTIIIAVLLVQFVAMAGAWLLGLLATRAGAKRVMVACLAVWTVVLADAFYLPAGAPGQFFLLAVLIGLVLGGSQALSRSLFSHMTPAGREAEYFSLYEIAGRGTSWLGSVLFGLALQASGSYRASIISLVTLFAAGLALLVRADVRTAAAEARNQAPARL
jgi:MFS transporter, UMF1 family